MKPFSFCYEEEVGKWFQRTRETKLPFLKLSVYLEGPTSMQLECAWPLMVFVAQGFGH